MHSIGCIYRNGESDTHTTQLNTSTTVELFVFTQSLQSVARAIIKACPDSVLVSVQVVWAGTTHMGTGSAVKGNSIYVVANYSPPGNVVGRQNFADNVKPPT